MTGSCPVSAHVCRETAKERDEAHAEVERLRAALTDLVDGWEDTGRSDLHPLLRGAALSVAGQVRDVLWPEEAGDD